MIMLIDLMTKPPRVVDLRDEAPSRVGGAAFAEARQLRHGGTLALLVSQEPSLLMRGLNVQLHDNLAWTMAPLEHGWRVDVRHRADAPARDVVDVLGREHKLLDGMMVELLQRSNRQDAAGVARVFAELAVLLRRHIAFENDRLVPLCAEHERQARDGPAAIMLREHGEILRQLAATEESIAAGSREELEAYIAILSGTLAKHEHREEAGLFPRWRAAWFALSPQERDELLAHQAGS
jgi:hemerythrin-like domain-containing protein